MTRTVAELQRDLAQPTTAGRFGSPDLDRIHRLGTRRRRLRRSAVALASAMAVAVLAGTGYGVDALRAGGETGREVPVSDKSAEPAPTELSALAKRVLRDVPGAVRVSAWQVVIPAPGAPEEMSEKVTADELITGPAPLGGHDYTGVTAFPRSAFPHWLYDEVQRIEQEELGDEEGYPVGSTDMGILVDYGEAELGCVRMNHGDGEDANRPCSPAFLTDVGGARYFQWGMGTDDFLRSGAEMEVFTSDDYSLGEPGTIAIAGIDGTDVASADFVTTNGEKIPGTVEAGTLVAGDSMFFATVPGELARVVAYDADGDVIEDHQLKACDNPVDCEVR